MEGEAQVTEAAVPVATPEAPVNDLSQIVESPAPAEQPVAETPAPVQQKPEGFDPIDVRTATPEQIEARIRRLYGNMKKYETDSREARQANEILADQIRQINEAQGKIVNHLQTEDFRSAEQKLKSERKAAWQAGNSDLVDDVNDRLRQLDIRRMQTELQPRPQVQQPQQRPTLDQTVDSSVQRGLLTHEEATTYKAWQSETDNYNQPKRPWLNENDPSFKAALRVGAGVLDSPAMQGKSLGEKLKEIDRLMGIQSTQPTQNVLGSGNLTRTSKTNNVKLTEYEARIAIKTKFGGPKAKSDADHAEAYRQAKIKSQSKGASR